MKYNKITEAYIGMMGILTEAIHSDIQSIMDNDSIHPSRKLNAVTKKSRELIKSGQDTGLESDKPKKGSSRAVFFPRDKKEITLDGVKTSTPTAVKIAFQGKLDPYHGEDSLLGEDQNGIESDHFVNQEYGVLSKNSDGHYESSTHESGGVLAPVFETHQDYHHLEMGRVEKFNSKDLADHTKNKEFPKGLKLDDIRNSLLKIHSEAHGQDYRGSDSDKLDKVASHPYVEHLTDMMHNSGMHPGDIAPRNMGIYVHPVTGHRHPVMIDWGFSNDIAKKYNKAHRSMVLRRQLGY